MIMEKLIFMIRIIMIFILISHTHSDKPITKGHNRIMNQVKCQYEC